MKISKEKYEISKARKCMSTEEVSKLSKVSIPVLNRIGKDTNDFRATTVGRIAKALGVDVIEIIEM